jgi:uncharacterized protein YyaL (SSP411 family)
MNDLYVSIKVDREERPDVDAIYMAAVQALTGSGGWPMSVWLTPDREPFFGGTYFPPRDGARGASHGFLTLLRDVHEAYKSDPARVGRATAALVNAVRGRMGSSGGDGSGAPAAKGRVPPSLITDTVTVFKRIFDDRDGGVRRAPKFPSNVPIRLLLRAHARTKDDVALLMAALTLEKMAAGGIYDQLAGGFHRYSTDARWLVPHFEKMLYDNALLIVAYAEAHQVTGREDFARVARDTLEYLHREMTAPEGGFYSATDADSKRPDGKSEEGAFFVWSEAEIRQHLGADADRFIRFYGVTAEGNFEGANILAIAAPDEREHGALAPQRAVLYATRLRRPPPFRDDKILAAWNGLAISAFAVGGRLFDEPRYVDAAVRAATFLLDRMRPGGRLARSAKDGRSGVAGFLDDYAFACAGLIDLFEATFDGRWLRAAIALADDVERLFADPAGGWFMTAADQEKLIAREKPTYDGAEPSGTSVAMLNALRLATFTSDDRWRAIADKAFAAVAPTLTENPLALTEALLALDYTSDEPKEIAIVWPRDAGPEAARPLLEVARRTFVPNRALAAASEADVAALGALIPFIADKTAVGGRATAYVCVRGRCELPVQEPEALAALLTRRLPYSA